jgi:hypothetical protein
LNVNAGGWVLTLRKLVVWRRVHVLKVFCCKSGSRGRSPHRI